MSLTVALCGEVEATTDGTTFTLTPGPALTTDRTYLLFGVATPVSLNPADVETPAVTSPGLTWTMLSEQPFSDKQVWVMEGVGTPTAGNVTITFSVTHTNCMANLVEVWDTDDCGSYIAGTVTNTESSSEDIWVDDTVSDGGFIVAGTGAVFASFNAVSPYVELNDIGSPLGTGDAALGTHYGVSTGGVQDIALLGSPEDWATIAVVFESTGVPGTAPWVNLGSGHEAANGTTSHSVSFGFTSTTGNLLVFVAASPATNAITGWTSRVNPNAASGHVNVFTKTSAGESSVTVTHGFTNMQMQWVVYEFSAGSSFTAAQAGPVDTTTTFTTITGLPGSTEQVAIAVIGRGVSGASGTGSADTWTGTVYEDTDQFSHNTGVDGFFLATAHQPFVLSSLLPTVNVTTVGSPWSTYPYLKAVVAFEVPCVIVGDEPAAVTVDFMTVTPATFDLGSFTPPATPVPGVAIVSGTPATFDVTADPPVPPEPPEPPEPAPAGVRIDWDDDGDYDDTGEDVTGYVLDTIRISRGRDQIRAFAPPMAPVLDLTLDNADNRFWPDNASSPLYPNVRDQHTVAVTFTNASVDYTLFTGQVTGWTMDLAEKVTVAAMGGVALHLGDTVTTPVLEGARTGDAITVLLDLIGWPANLRTIDRGATIMRYWWERDIDVYAAMMRLVACEGPPARVDVTADGFFVFEDRHHRLINSLTPASTLVDEGDEPVLTRPFIPDIGWDSVVNEVTVTPNTWGYGDLETIEWTGTKVGTGVPLQDSVTLEFDQPVKVVGKAATHGTVYRWASTWTVNGVTFEFDPDEPAGVQFELIPLAPYVPYPAVTITGALVDPTGPGTGTLGAGDILTAVTVTGRRLATTPGEPVTVGDGGRGLPGGLDAPFLDAPHAEAVANSWVDYYSAPLARVQVTLDGDVEERITEEFTRQVSERVHVTVGDGFIDRDYYVEQIHHDIVLPLPWIVTTFGLEEVPVVEPAGDEVFILGDATQGKLGTGKLAH